MGGTLPSPDLFSFLFLYVEMVHFYALIMTSKGIVTQHKQVAQLSQRDRAAGWVSYGQKWKTANGRQYFTDILGLSMT